MVREINLLYSDLEKQVCRYQYRFIYIKSTVNAIFFYSFAFGILDLLKKYSSLLEEESLLNFIIIKPIPISQSSGHYLYVMDI